MEAKEFFGLDYIFNGVKLGDIKIQDKPLRDWKVAEIGTSYAEYDAWLNQVFLAIPLGNDLDDIISEEFCNEFYRIRNEYLDAEHDVTQTKLFETYARELLQDTDTVEIVNIFTIPHAGWELDYKYAVARINGELLYIGTNHGSPEFLTKEDIQSLRDNIAATLAAIDNALTLE